MSSARSFFTRGRVGQAAELLAPVEVLAHHERMQQGLEPVERLGVGEDELRDRAPVDLARLVEDPVAEALDHRLAHGGVLAEEPVNDLVAGDRRGAVPCEGGEGLALPRSDAAGDGDGEWARHYSGAAGGSPSESPGPGSSGATASASTLSSRSSSAAGSSAASASATGSGAPASR